jgi:hypothetical protein
MEPSPLPCHFCKITGRYLAPITSKAGTNYDVCTICIRLLKFCDTCDIPIHRECKACKAKAESQFIERIDNLEKKTNEFMDTQNKLLIQINEQQKLISQLLDTMHVV